MPTTPDHIPPLPEKGKGTARSTPRRLFAFLAIAMAVIGPLSLVGLKIALDYDVDIGLAPLMSIMVTVLGSIGASLISLVLVFTEKK